MAFCDAHWYSPTLNKQVATYVILPETGNGPFPTLYLLHGLSDDHTIWHRRTRIESLVSGLPLIVVMPDGFRGFYTNNTTGPAYAKYMTEDLVTFVERTFPAKRARSARCVGGLSMGGYGALRLALGRPDLYVSAHSHSGALMHGTLPNFVRDRPEFEVVFGKRPKGSSHDLVHLARRAKARGKLPKIRIDCGSEDRLAEGNRLFARELRKLNIPHEYEEFPGDHNWDYWADHIRDGLVFHARHLGLDL